MTESESPSPDPTAEEVFAIVYDRLRSLAQRQFGIGEASTLQPTAIVHEAYLKLSDWDGAAWADEEHFCAIAARAMRQVMADHARHRRRDKRGGDRQRVTLVDLANDDSGAIDLLALDEALGKLEQLNERHARLVELRVFAGLSPKQAADALGISLSTAEKDWRCARAWLGKQVDDT